MAIPTNANKIVSSKSNTYFKANKITIDTAVPTAGTYAKGDIIINSSPSAEAIGWICTAEGSPGTWKAIKSGVDVTSMPWNSVTGKPGTFTPTLGVTSTTAFRGDHGNTAYQHSQAAHAPSNAQKNSDITKAEIEAKLTGTITSHAHNYAGSSSAGGKATEAAKTTGTLTIQTNGTSAGTFNGSANKTVNITPANIGAAVSNHSHSEYAASSHSHGLLNSNFTKEISGSTGGWELINSTNKGYLLTSIRGGNSVPAWFDSAYSSGIIFGGSDTKGILSMSYSSPSITFAGGSSSPTWHMKITGSNNTTYNLNNYATKTELGDIQSILQEINGE